eukprot:392139-Alexandrium_andersonii.AAC.1
MGAHCPSERSLRSAVSPEDIGVADGARLTLVSLPPLRIAIQGREGGGWGVHAHMRHTCPSTGARPDTFGTSSV